MTKTNKQRLMILKLMDTIFNKYIQYVQRNKKGGKIIKNCHTDLKNKRTFKNENIQQLKTVKRKSEFRRKKNKAELTK